MNRRELVLLLGSALTAARGVRAQQTRRTFRVGILSAQPREGPSWVAFFDELGKAGFVEGRNLIIDWRVLDARPERAAALAAELVQLAPDVLLPASGARAIVPAQAATRTIPMLGIDDDMVASGLVPSLARPGGNLTGISILASELDGKRQELLMELVPSSHHMAALADPGATSPSRLETLRQASAARGVELSIYPARGPEELAAAVDAAHAAGCTALNLLASPILNAARNIVMEQSATLRLPAIYQWPETAEEGGLVAYGPRFAKVFRQFAGQLVKILHGAKPADIPVEQPTRFELVINLSTAKALGLAVPQTLLLRADEVIE